MIGNGLEFDFHWRKLFDVIYDKKRESTKVTFPTILSHFVPISTVVKSNFSLCFFIRVLWKQIPV